MMLGSQCAANESNPDVLNIEPPRQESGGSVAETPVNLVNLMGIVHIVNLIC
jgi:hypothetical protein